MTCCNTEKGGQKEVFSSSSHQEGDSSKGSSSKTTNNHSGKPSGFGTSFFDFGIGGKFYDGGFLDSMTRREAAQILGIRETASAERIKDAHRRILMANHPDRGGSPYMAAKINEAKEMLLKGKS